MNIEHLIEPDNACDWCDKPLKMVADYAIGVEWHCGNTDCPTNNLKF